MLRDSQVWDAKDFDAAGFTVGTVTCTRRSPAIANLGGGDYDGDTVHCVQDPDFLALVGSSAQRRCTVSPAHSIDARHTQDHHLRTTGIS